LHLVALLERVETSAGWNAIKRKCALPIEPLLTLLNVAGSIGPLWRSGSRLLTNCKTLKKNLGNQ
jgi:hypothetical protein